MKSTKKIGEKSFFSVFRCKWDPSRFFGIDFSENHSGGTSVVLAVVCDAKDNILFFHQNKNEQFKGNIFCLV